ncbi:MAG: hypothetical protein EOM35_07055 [Negativicutes bacterium]|nr:hypothetical protein [Negativicutes bacterium]
MNYDEPTTANTTVVIFAEHLGTPTQCRYSDTDITKALWQPIPDNFTKTSEIVADFAWESSGLKTIYVQLRDSEVESVVKSDSIEYLHTAAYKYTVELSSPTHTPAAVQASIPVLKYDKKLAFSYVTDDSNSPYQYIFSRINKRMVPRRFKLPDGRAMIWHFGMEGKPSEEQYIGEKYYPTQPLQYTDGAGIPKRYTSSVACWFEKFYKSDGSFEETGGGMFPWITKPEAELYRDFGFSFMFHDLPDYTTSCTQTEFNDSVNKAIDLAVRATGVKPYAMAEPNGDHRYITLCQGNPNIYTMCAQGGDSRIQKAYLFNPTNSLSVQDIVVQRLFAYGSDLTEDATDVEYARALLADLAAQQALADET